MIYAYRIIVSGIVQGVGFRPFIYRIAHKSGVKGYVKNLGGSEVEILIQGSNENVSKFFSLLFQELPYPARLENIYVEETQPSNFSDFIIMKSDKIVSKPSVIPPDFAVCDECLREVLDPKNPRRYRYAFNSCAYCGPRFSMMYRVPYDRENTSMNAFPLCEHCKREYYDPNDIRRFDAQGISCKLCGPKLYLESVNGERIEDEDPIRIAGKLLKEGYILAVKGIGGFHIAALATDDDTILRLRERKRRPNQPFAIMVQSIEVAKKYVHISEFEETILRSPERPIVLLKKREPYELSKYISPGLDREGIFLFYTPLHYLLLDEIPEKLLIMTSANIHGFPMCRSEDCVRSKLRGVVDFILYHDREIVNRVDDSVVRVSNGRLMMIRRGRGYAPHWIKIPIKLKNPVIAVGAELQNAGAIGFDDKVIMTQYIGDTDNYETLRELEDSLMFFLSAYNLRPKIVIADKNPAYQSTYLAEKLADKFSARLIQVQHHYAHVISAAIDNGYTEGVGIAIDGIGYGDDGNGWGGEIIQFNLNEYKRTHHLEYIPYIGGDLNAIYPGRMLILFLSKILDKDEILEIYKRKNLFLKNGEKELNALLNITKEKKYLKTSSLGRVLDAVSAYLNICNYRTYEGEPAMKLEAVARGGKLLDLEIPIVNEEIITSKIFQWLIEVEGKYSINDIAFTVQYELGRALIKAALKSNPKRVFVAGGAAVNEYILKGIVDNSEGIEIITPKRVPAGDGGIALGQVGFVSFIEDGI